MIGIPKMAEMDIILERAAAPTAEVIELLGALNRALEGPYSPDQKHALSVDQLFQPNIRFYLAWMNGEAVACGGVGFYDDYAELKRMYARPAVQGQGVAKALLGRLEADAREMGVPSLRIETGLYQHAALKFYERAGFRRCGPFGPYAAMAPKAIETSLFYEKALG